MCVQTSAEIIIAGIVHIKSRPRGSKVCCFLEGCLYLVMVTDRRKISSQRLAEAKVHSIQSLFCVNLQPKETEQPAWSRALSWNTDASLAGPPVQPKTLWDLRPHTRWPDQQALRWVCLFALTALPTLHPFTNTVSTIAASTDGDYTLCLLTKHHPSPLPPFLRFGFTGCNRGIPLPCMVLCSCAH